MDLQNYLRNHQKTHLIFDFDETLFHLILPWDQWEENIKDKLIKVDKIILKNYQDNKISLSQLMNQYGSQYPKTKELIIQNCLKFETENLNDVVVNPRLLDFIKNAQNYQMFLWTSNTRPTVQRLLKKFNLQNKFRQIVTRNDVNLLKPDPEGFYQIYDPKISKQNYLLIGDSQADKQVCQKLDLVFYLVDYFKNIKEKNRTRS